VGKEYEAFDDDEVPAFDQKFAESFSSSSAPDFGEVDGGDMLPPIRPVPTSVGYDRRLRKDLENNVHNSNRSWLMQVWTLFFMSFLTLPLGATFLPPASRSAFVEIAETGVVGKTQFWATLVYLVILLHYFPNPGVLDLIKRFTSKK
jgi:hypothetical protein